MPTSETSQGNQNIQRRVFLPHISRRTIIRDGFFAGGIITLAGTLEGLAKGHEVIDEEKRIYQEAQKPASEFRDATRDLFSNVSFGTTFVPEDFRDNKALGLRGLTWLHNDLGMRHLRVAIRQDTFPDITNPNPDLSYYADYFKLMKQLGFKVTLCIGAKTPVYPESHIDAKTKNAEPQLKDNNSVISLKPKTGLGKRLLDQTERIAQAFVRQFPELIEEGTIDAIQPSNEPFFIDGKPQFDVTPEFLAEEIKRLRNVFGNVPILLNHFGVPDLHHVLSGTQLTRAFTFAKHLRSANIPVIVGYDYYKYTDTNTEVGGTVIDSIAITKFLALSGTKIFENIRRACKSLGITLSVSELAWEHWGKHFEPEINFQEFAGQLLRVLQSVLDPSSPTQIDLFGSTTQIKDRFNQDLGLKQVTQGQEDMYWFIRDVNKQHGAL